jgi:hypothetical protein
MYIWIITCSTVTPRIAEFKVTQFQAEDITNLGSSIKSKKIKITAFMGCAQKFCLWECRRIETKVAERYCWTMTLAVPWGCSHRSDSCVLEFGFKLVFLYIRTWLTGCTRVYDSFKIRLEPNLLERNYCFSRGVSVVKKWENRKSSYG